MNVLVWYENKPLPEAVEAERRIYPNGIHGALGELFVTQPDFLVRTRVMQDTDQGFADEDLNWVNVLVYFSHKHWRDIADDALTLYKNACLKAWGFYFYIPPCKQDFLPSMVHAPNACAGEKQMNGNAYGQLIQHIPLRRV